jgi:transmembrane sensor
MTLFTTDQREWTELARYLAGELTPSEADRVERACAADPARAARLEEARRVWNAAGCPAPAADAGAALQRIKARAAAGARVVPAPRFRVEPAGGWSRGIAAAAAAVLLVGGGWWLAQRAGSRPADPGETAMAELTTLPGQRADLLLPDGSRVNLGMASRLRYPARHGGGARDLYLDGEAYFAVVHDSTRPFRVHTRRGVTQDVGTAFAIRAYGAGALNVVVAEGEAVLRATPTDSVMLGPADLGRVGTDGRLSLTRDVDLDSYLAWREDRLVFHHTPLPDVLEQLRARYGLDIEPGGDSGLDTLSFSASYSGEPAQTVLDELALTLGLRYERRGALTLVHLRRPPDRRPPNR